MLNAPVIKSLLQSAGDGGDDAGTFNTLALSGIAIPESVVTLFDGTNQLGTTTTDTDGSWIFRFSADQVSSGTHSFTATADLFGDTSAVSQALAATLDALGVSTTGSFSWEEAGSRNGAQYQELELISSAGPFTAAVTDLEGNTGALATPFDGRANQQHIETQILAAPAFVASPNSELTLSINDTADHVINAAESRAVAFTVAGLDVGASGTVTFTDTANHQVAVAVGGDGIFSANLSGLADGTITSELSATDPNGAGVSAAGNAVSLDTDSALQPSLSVNASDPANVTFVVSGLESDYSGTVTFTDTTGKSDVVAIGSNGTYSANLSNLTDGTLTYVMTVSDPAGNVITVDPTTELGSLPAGVTLQQIGGGPDYYADNGFTYAANAGWDSPSFFMIGIFAGSLTQQSDASRWLALGVNTSVGITDDSSLSIARSNGIWVIQDLSSDDPNQPLPGTGSETVGILTQDEPSTFAEGVSTPISTTPNSVQDGRFWYVNDTWNYLAFGPPGGTPAPGTQQAFLTAPITTPDGSTAHIDASSIDLYFFSGASTSAVQSWLGTLDKLPGGEATADEVARGSNYGALITDEEAYTGGATPVFAYIDDGGAYTQDTSTSDYITPSELNWAVWSSLIHGANGIIYFNNTFGGPDESDDNLANTFYQTVQPGQTVSIYTQVQQTDALISQLAPVLNSATALGYVTVNNASYENGTILSQFNGIEVMAKDDNGQFYIFADTADSLTQTNISATFTIADTSATSVTVVGENRTIPVVDGVFSDTFATAATVHIYEVNDPSGPTISSVVEVHPRAGTSTAAILAPLP